MLIEISTAGPGLPMADKNQRPFLFSRSEMRSLPRKTQVMDVLKKVVSARPSPIAA